MTTEYDADDFAYDFDRECCGADHSPSGIYTPCLLIRGHDGDHANPDGTVWRSDPASEEGDHFDFAAGQRKGCEKQADHILASDWMKNALETARRQGYAEGRESR